MQTDYDVIIIGAGLVGSSLALGLPDTLSIAVIEPLLPSTKQPNYLAVNLTSAKIWQAMGVWSELVAANITTAINDIEISETGEHKHRTLLSCEDVALAQLGYTIDAGAATQLLFAKVRDKKNVNLFCPGLATNIAQHDNVALVTVEQQTVTVLSAKLVIIADGGYSDLRHKLDFPVITKQYPQQIMLATVKVAQPHKNLAFERFTNAGPVALLPLGEDQYNLVWTLSQQEANLYLQMSDDSLLSKLQRFYGERAGKFMELGKRKMYPISHSYVKSPAKNRIILLGNAAHFVHPVGAQGFNLSLKDVAKLIELINKAQQNKHDIGSEQLLTEYVASRLDDTYFVLSFTVSLLAIFASNFMPLVKLRQLGLSIIDKLPLAKQAILKHTLGLSSPVGNIKIQLPVNKKSCAQSYDIVIIGNRLSGATLACALAAHYKILIIDKAPAPQLPGSDFQLRVNAYNRVAEQLLREIGVWQLLPTDRIFQFDKLAVTNENGGGSVTFNAHDCGESHIGSFIENDLVNFHLHEILKQKSNVTMLSNSAVQAIDHDADLITIVTDNVGSFTAKLLIGCDGASSKVRELLGIDVSYHAYHQKCIVGTVEFTGDLAATAWQKFRASGPIGLLPLAPGFCSLAWSCDKELAEKLMLMDEAAFIHELSQAIDGRLGSITRIKSRASFPLVARHAKDYVGIRAALVGDAAHVIHPLGGLGANIGFQDVIALCKLLNSPLNKERDIGRRYILSQYQKTRRWHNSATMTIMTGFNSVFSNDLPGLKQLRNLSLQIADKITPAKKILLQHAMWMGCTPEEISRIIRLA